MILSRHEHNLYSLIQVCNFAVCQTKLDLAFVVDSSGSVGSRNYQTVKESLKSMVDFYNVGLDQTRIALVSYSYSVCTLLKNVLKLEG